MLEAAWGGGEARLCGQRQRSEEAVGEAQRLEAERKRALAALEERLRKEFAGREAELRRQHDDAQLAQLAQLQTAQGAKHSSSWLCAHTIFTTNTTSVPYEHDPQCRVNTHAQYTQTPSWNKKILIFRMIFFYTLSASWFFRKMHLF